MALINPAIAKRERNRLKLSLEDLARRSGVNKTTLHRIETGRMQRNAEHVVERLAKVFKLRPDELTAVIDPSEDNEAEKFFSYRSQFNVRIAHETRNALALVAWRYHVKPLDIVELAPLLFHVVAAETLRERRDRLTALREARERIADMSGQFPHLHERMLNDWNGEEIELREENSIAARDIRGEMIEDGDDFIDTRPLDYDEGAHNPFITQLRDRLAAVQEPDREPELFDYWNDGMLQYEICREEARAYLGGDTEAAEHIIAGRVGLHELPRELREADQIAQRAAWIRERADELGARNAAWLETLGFGEI